MSDATPWKKLDPWTMSAWAAQCAAHELGLPPGTDITKLREFFAEFQRVTRVDEREACAKMLDEYEEALLGEGDSEMAHGVTNAAEMIRRRSSERHGEGR